MQLGPGFEAKISRLDTSLYKSIDAELNEADRRSLLAIQKAVREHNSAYCYLEIGSHLGGSIQPYLLDSRCFKIYSIDKRPLVIPDARGRPIEYPDNSTERMLGLLSNLSVTGAAKIVCFDDDAKNIDPALINERPDICFIDGEHTSEAVFSDFQFCYSVIKDDGLICFHDSEIVWKGLRVIVRHLKSRRVPFQFLKLGGAVSVIGLNESVSTKRNELKEVASSGWGYFAFHQKVTEAHKEYFDNGLVNVLKPGIKSTLSVLRRLSVFVDFHIRS